MDGCRDYIMRGGLDVPQCVKDATENYKRMYDRIGSFIHDCCVIDDNEKIQRGDLYLVYRQWCLRGENKFNPLGSTSFYNEMIVRGFPIQKSTEWYVKGLTVKSSSKT